MSSQSTTAAAQPRELDSDTAFAGRLALRIGIGAVCLMLALALVSYSSDDANIIEGGLGNRGVANWIGPLGAILSRTAVIWLGLAAYPAVLLVLTCVVNRCCRLEQRPPRAVYFAAPLLAVIGTSFLLGCFPDLFGALTARLNLSETPGGVIGQRFCEPWTAVAGGGWLAYVVHPTGCVIISAAMIGVALGVIWYFDWQAVTRRGIDYLRARAAAAAPESADEAVADEPEHRLKRKLVRPSADDELPLRPTLEPAALTVPEPAVAAANPEPVLPLEEPPPPALKASEAIPAPQPMAAPPPAAPVARSLPTSSLTDYRLPGIELLQPPSPSRSGVSPKEVEAKRQALQETLDSFGIDAHVGGTTTGPRVTLFEIKPAPGVKVEKISSLANNIAMNLKAESLRILTPIPGKDTVGIEAPNSIASPVSFRELIEQDAWRNTKAVLPIVLGKDIGGKPVILDLAKAPHLLIAGSTGSGKSVCMNTLILSMLFRFPPDELKMIMVDPKVVEFNGYNALPHLVTPVVTDVKKVPIALRWALNQMEWRYQILSKVGVRNIASYNSRPKAAEPVLDDDGTPVPDKLPFLVIIVDELADIMMTAKADVETSLARIAQLARAVGIHTVIATQRPSVNIITGVIKANFPTRIAFQVTSVVDSRTILDGKGAESLLGRGDMLFKPPGGARLERTQGAFSPDEDIERVVEFVAAQAQAEYIEDIFSSASDGVESEEGTALAASEGVDIANAGDSDEDLVQKAIQIILQDRRATTSHIQRRLRIGYNRAALIIEALEERGIIGAQVGTAPRQILIGDDSDD